MTQSLITKCAIPSMFQNVFVNFIGASSHRTTMMFKMTEHVFSFIHFPMQVHGPVWPFTITNLCLMTSKRFHIAILRVKHIGYHLKTTQTVANKNPIPI